MSFCFVFVFYLTLTNKLARILCITKKNLLHRGRGVQEGQEVQAFQAGRAYHLFQGGQRDPASEKRDRKKGDIRN